MARELIFYPDPRLQEKCAEVADVGAVQDIVADLKRICAEYNGLAAPQIGELVRIFYVRRLDQIFINPKIVEQSEETDVMEERCLSLPDLLVSVRRPTRVAVDAIDEKGEQFSRELIDFPARVYCHEADHLDGILTIDRREDG